MRFSFRNIGAAEAREIFPPCVEVKNEITKTDNGYIVKRRIRNASDKSVSVGELSLLLSGISFGGSPSDDYFYCNENNRVYGVMTIPVDYDREDLHSPLNARFDTVTDDRWADSSVTGKRICASPYQPFPAILLSNYKSRFGLIVGSLSQDVFYHCFETGHSDEGLFLTIVSSFKGVSRRELSVGEELYDEFCILETDRADDINVLFNDYAALLRERLSGNCGAAQTNRHTLIWDSWNDGIYRNVSQDMLVGEAKAVKKLFPNAEWFQLDDGYSAFCDENPDLSAHGLGVAYEGADGVDRKKFPEGLKGYTDKIKETGLKPSLWIGGLCPVQSKICKERPEWFVDYSYRIDFSRPLDVSKEEVREYINYAFDELVEKSGFEGVKLDFWSYAFEDGHDLLHNKQKSGYEHREWLHKTLRSKIPTYGYLQTGCDVCEGNPFIGKYFNNYRFGLDVGAGNWNNIKTTMFWGMACLTTHTGDLFIPNSDSIGLLPGLNDTDFMFVVNYQIITRTLVEISGRFTKKDLNKDRLAVIRRATQYLNNGEDVYFPRYDYRKTGMNIPEIIYTNSAFDGRAPKDGEIIKTVGLFNAEEREKAVAFTLKDIGIEGHAQFTDVWSGESSTGDGCCCVLSPHKSKLLIVTALTSDKINNIMNEVH